MAKRRSVEPITKPHCHGCGKKNEALDGEVAVQLRRVKAVNGVFHVLWYCVCCNKPAEIPMRWISRVTVDQLLVPFAKTFDTIPVLRDHSEDSPECVVCGALETEYHHWMPQCLSGDLAVEADWPAWESIGAYLCKKHHKIWHDAVTPWMWAKGAA